MKYQVYPYLLSWQAFVRCRRLSANGSASTVEASLHLKVTVSVISCDVTRARFGVIPRRNLLCESRPATQALPPSILSLLNLFIVMNAHRVHAFVLMSPSDVSYFPVKGAVTALRRAPSVTTVAHPAVLVDSPVPVYPLAPSVSRWARAGSHFPCSPLCCP